jgi:hypothetical protein
MPAMFAIWETPEDMTDHERVALSEWLSANFEVDPSDLLPQAVILRDVHGAASLHLTRYLTDETGHYYVADWAQNRAATEPIVIPLRDGFHCPPVRNATHRTLAS